MSGKRYPEEFKIEAVKQVTERGHPAERQKADDQQAEMKRLKAELKRVTEERDTLKRGRRVLCQDVRVRYAFIRGARNEHSIRRLCKMMALHPSGFYAWCTEPESLRALEDRRLLGHIKQSWLESGAVYGVTDITDVRTHEGWLYLAAVLDLFRARSSDGRWLREWIASSL